MFGDNVTIGFLCFAHSILDRLILMDMQVFEIAIPFQF